MKGSVNDGLVLLECVTVLRALTFAAGEFLLWSVVSILCRADLRLIAEGRVPVVKDGALAALLDAAKAFKASNRASLVRCHPLKSVLSLLCFLAGMQSNVLLALRNLSLSVAEIDAANQLLMIDAVLLCLKVWSLPNSLSAGMASLNRVTAVAAARG